MKRKYEPKNEFYCPNCNKKRKFKKVYNKREVMTKKGLKTYNDFEHPKYKKIECKKCHNTYIR